MKKHLYWITVFAALCLVCAVATALMNKNGGLTATVTVGGETVRTLDLSEDCELDITLEDGEFNHISVRDGRVAVTDANCPDRVCVRRGYISGGVPIICLPHRLTVEVQSGAADVDAVTGR